MSWKFGQNNLHSIGANTNSKLAVAHFLCKKLWHWMDGWMGGWMDGWMDGCWSRFKDCLQQSKIFFLFCIFLSKLLGFVLKKRLICLYFLSLSLSFKNRIFQVNIVHISEILIKNDNKSWSLKVLIVIILHLQRIFQR